MALTGFIVHGRGMCHECPYSPRLFTVGLDWAVRRGIAANPAFSIDLLRRLLLPLLLSYANDLLLIARTIEDLLAFLLSFIPAMALVGMQVNFDKSEIIIRLPVRVQPQLPLQIGQWISRKVDRLVYLRGSCRPGWAARRLSITA